MLSTDRKLTAAEFLSLPEGDITYELVDGQAVPKDNPMSPTRFHSRLQPIVWQMLEQWCSSQDGLKPGSAHTEWAVVLKRKQEEWIPIPDVTYISDQKLPVSAMTDDPCMETPELVVEIISPSQTFGEMTEKATDYLDAGILRVWIVDPLAKSITVFYPDAPPRTFTDSNILMDPLFPGLEITPKIVFEQARIP